MSWASACTSKQDSMSNQKLFQNYYRSRPIPLAKVEEDLNILARLRVISKVETFRWETSMVPVRKPNGSVHLCGDYEVIINPYLKVNQYPLPRPEEI